MRRYPRGVLVLALTLLCSLAMAAGAQAVVVNVPAAGQFGVALAPGTDLGKAGIQTVAPNGPCSDPFLASGFTQPAGELCWWNVGSVMHGNETFALTWDPLRRYWANTRNYVEQFLRDVADGSGRLSSPYAVTTQYRDGSIPQDGLTDRAGNASRYGGGCIDYGSVGTNGATCVFPNAVANGVGNAYPTSGCSAGDASYGATGKLACLTDAQLQAWLTTTVKHMGLVDHLQPGYTPLLVVMTPPGLDVCVDLGGKLCSANSTETAQFCSYHSYLRVGTQAFAYVVQPWTAYTACDDRAVPPPATNAGEDPVDVGRRLVGPISQGQIAAITDPWLTGWTGADGSEINDHGGCVSSKSDSAIVGTSSQNPYYLPPEFSNAGLLETDPNAPRCAEGVFLSPTFVVPSPIDQGDAVAFDGSVTGSSLLVPNGDYQWTFGDGTTEIGPSVVHSYAAAGTYTVQLTVTDRGGNVSSIAQQVEVLGPGGQPATTPIVKPLLRAKIQLIPQSLGTVLHAGLAMYVSSNEPADGIATVSIPRAAARQAHIGVGRAGTVVIGRGTVSQIKIGTVGLRVRLTGAIASKLRTLHQVTLTVHLLLVTASGDRLATSVVGTY